MSMLDPNMIRNKNEFEEMKNQVKESMEKLESYPYNAEFFYTTSLCRVNLDAKRQESIFPSEFLSLGKYYLKK